MSRRRLRTLLLVAAVAVALPAGLTSATATAVPAGTSASVAAPEAVHLATLPRAVAPATPVADDDASYDRCGRVFPDPQAYAPLAHPLPGESPWAKGNLRCRAVDFIQFDEAVSGLHYLAQKFPRFVQVYNLREDFANVLDVDQGEGQSAGLPTNTLQRDRSDLYMVRITDENVPAKQKKNFLFTLSLHGIEKAGLEGGLRAAEDLATWGATDPDQPVMETLPSSLPVGEVLRKSQAWFALYNPDGWRRGDTSLGGLAYQRYNGNGVDLNRDFPEPGFTFRPYTPASEPETASFMKVWKHISPTWAGGVDLHGQLINRAFSFTLLGASQRPYDKNQRMLQFTRGAYQDAERRLAWNPLIKPNEAPPGCVPPSTSVQINTPPCDPTPRVYGVQFGSIWDTIAYTATGAIGDWADSELGLSADFIDNEMSLSHIANCGTGKCFSQSAEQLHVDGNKSLIYGMLNFSLLPEDTTFRATGRTAYLTRPKRLAHEGTDARPSENLPLQDPVNATVVKVPGNAPTVEFEVLSDSAGRANEGVKARATFSNIQGVGPGAVLGIAIDKLDEREAPPGQSEWTVVNEDYNQDEIYLQSGMQVDANDLTPGRYRARITGEGAAAVEIDIRFTRGRAWPDPGQLAFDVSNLDFFEELRPLTPKGMLTPVMAKQVAAGEGKLGRFDSVIVVDHVLRKRDKELANRLKRFAARGGNVVLTDDALYGLETMGIVRKGAVVTVPVYAGSVSFQPGADANGEPYGHPLARNLHEPGAAEGPLHRKQTSEPVPTGHAIQDPDGGDLETVPQTGVLPGAWLQARGTNVGVIGDSNDDEVTYGEVAVGKGVVRILGSVLPFPTDEYDHPFGLSSYAITPTAYEMVRNLISYRFGAGPSVVPGDDDRNGNGNGDDDDSDNRDNGGLAATGLPYGVGVGGAALLLMGSAAYAVRRRRV